MPASRRVFTPWYTGQADNPEARHRERACMDPTPHTPFEPGWWSFDLGRYRPCDGTYCLFPYESLPPIPAPDETLSWLAPLGAPIDRQMEVHRNPPAARGKLEPIVTAAAELGLTLPDAFVRLMAAPDLQDRIPSCTACTFELGDRIIPCPGSAGGYIVRFLRDQQDCVMWYLYLTPAGEHCVLAFPGDLESFVDAAAAGQAVDLAAVIRHIWVCAPSFAAFIYRFWLENTIWFKLGGDEKAPLTAAERRYLEHYEQKPRAGS
jgi:hypothetical protein